jgi:RHS repeat-associated protein
VEKSSGTYYWFSPSGSVLAETDTGGNTLNEYIYFSGGRTARRDSSGNVYYYFGDHLGTSRVIANASGTMCYDADYTPFGHEMAYTTSCSQNYKFTGLECDSETGNDHAWFRYYEQNLGRWLSPDPLGGDITNPQSLNRYAYVLNNPTTLVDPVGLHPVYAPPPCEYTGDCPGGDGGVGGGVGGSCDPLLDPACPCDPNDPSCNPNPCIPELDPTCNMPPGGGGGGGGGGGAGGSGGAARSPSQTGVGNAGWPNGGDYGPMGPLSLWQLFGPYGGVYPCDFGVCGAVTPNGFVSDVVLTQQGFTIYVRVMELVELPLWMQVLRQAGRTASPMASPWAPVAWYGGSAAVALLPAAPSMAKALWDWATLNPVAWRCATSFVSNLFGPPGPSGVDADEYPCGRAGQMVSAGIWSITHPNGQ